MENFIPLFEDRLPFSLLCFFILFAYILSGVKIQDRLKVGILYIITYALIFMNLDPLIAIISLIVTSFCCLEYFSSDKRKNEDLKLSEKVLDYVYAMIIECRVMFFFCILGGTFCLAEIVNNYSQHTATDWLHNNIAMVMGFTVIVLALLFLILLHFVSSPKFLKKSYSEILNKLTLKPVFAYYEETDIEKFKMLIAMEDHKFLDRDVDEHTVLSFTMCGYYLKIIGITELIRRIWQHKSSVWRGYGTIDMQLMRNVGIEKGYECKVRRKFFEVCYSRIIYNSYYRKVGNSPELFKYWILENYIDNVRVKINNKIYAPEGGNVFDHAFGKNFEELSKEEFFVWCLGLRNYGKIGDRVLKMNQDIINEFRISIPCVKGVLLNFN